MTPPNSTVTRWRKSSRSDGTGGECVEVAAMPAPTATGDSAHPAAPARSAAGEP